MQDVNEFAMADFNKHRPSFPEHVTTTNALNSGAVARDEKWKAKTL
jgi:hypothetical protein